jgi:hypothetical protein
MKLVKNINKKPCRIKKNINKKRMGIEFDRKKLKGDDILNKKQF